MISKDKLDLLKQQYLSVTNDINKPIDLEALEILTTKLGQNIPKNAEKCRSGWKWVHRI